MFPFIFSARLPIVFEPPDSRSRYLAVEKEFSRGGSVDERRVMGVLGDHSGLVCSHRDDIGLGTLWSTVTHVNSRRVWRAEGHPCKTPFTPDARLAD